MKVKVLDKFRDRHTREWHKVDDVIDISEERYDEILTVGNLVEAMEEPAEEQEAPRKRGSKKAAN